MKGPLAKAIERDLTARLADDLNTVVRIILEELPAYSPQYTGFFASSWKTSKSRIKAKDQVQKNSPWSSIKIDKTRAYFGAGGGAAGRAAARSISPLIQPRFTTPLFKLTDSIFIGNTVEYAKYALVASDNKIVNFIQGEIGPLIKSVFKESKSPNLRVAATFRGASEAPSGVRYISP